MNLLQQVYVNGVRLPPKTVVHIWTGNRYELLYKVTRDGLPALLSTCWYLDHLATGGDWRKFYSCDPHDFNGTDLQKGLVMGGEACMWGEVVDDSNILQRYSIKKNGAKLEDQFCFSLFRIFPRASAAAEKLWSQMHVNDTEDAAKRLEEHYCRMRIRGIPAQPPSGPGYCL
jgi:hexosaminidase